MAKFRKRVFMQALPILLLALYLASCGKSDQQNSSQPKVEVFSWWTSGSEAAALNTVFEAFRQQHPEIELVNSAIAGGGGSAARPVLQTRLVGNNPPDTWQTHPGAEVLSQYVASGFVASLADLYKEERWYDVMPKTLIDMISKDGQPYMVVLNVHRSNELWYNKKVLAQHGITVGATMSFEEFFKIAERLQQQGVTPLAVGDAGIWATGIMFENTLVGVIGPQRYLGLWNGSTSFEEASVKEAMRIYGRLLDYQNTDHAALSWDQAVKKMTEGTCAFMAMGDWAYGELTNMGLQDNVDFGWVSHPGTDSAFVLVSDGFVLAKEAPHPQQARELLRMMGMKSAQEIFNQRKGSICARLDCDRTKFSSYLNWSMDSFAQDAIVPTIIHGSAAPADFQQALNDALTTFVVERNVEQFAQALAQAARMSGFGK